MPDRLLTNILRDPGEPMIDEKGNTMNQEDERCCDMTCSRDAEFDIKAPDGSETVACEKHVGPLLGHVNAGVPDVWTVSARPLARATVAERAAVVAAKAAWATLFKQREDTHGTAVAMGAFPKLDGSAWLLIVRAAIAHKDPE